MKLLMIVIAAYVIGYVVFTTLPGNANLDDPTWYKIFVIWHNTFHAGVFAWGMVYHLGRPQVKQLVLPVYIYSTIMGAWQISSLFTGLDINNEWAILAIFLVLTFVVGVYCFKAFKKIDKYI